MGMHTNPYAPRDRIMDRVEERHPDAGTTELPDDLVAKLVQAGASTQEVDDIAAGWRAADGRQRSGLLLALEHMSIEETTEALEEARVVRSQEREQHVLGLEGIEVPQEGIAAGGWDEALEGPIPGAAPAEGEELVGDGTGEALEDLETVEGEQVGFAEVQIPDDDEDEQETTAALEDGRPLEENLEVPEAADEIPAWIGDSPIRARAAWEAELDRKKATGKKQRVTVRRAAEAVLGPLE